MRFWIVFILFFICGNDRVNAQQSSLDSTEEMVISAIQKSEQALYDANFNRALAVLRGSLFQGNQDFNDVHNVRLQLQRIRV